MTVVGLWVTLRSTGLGLGGGNITCGGPKQRKAEECVSWRDGKSS